MPLTQGSWSTHTHSTDTRAPAASAWGEERGELLFNGDREKPSHTFIHRTAFKSNLTFKMDVFELRSFLPCIPWEYCKSWDSTLAACCVLLPLP